MTPQADDTTTRPRRPQTGPRPLTEPFRRQLAGIERGTEDLAGLLREQLDRRPCATLGAGLAAGFVLGGGLTLRLTTSLVAIAGRVAMANMVSSALRGLRPTTERIDA